MRCILPSEFETEVPMGIHPQLQEVAGFPARDFEACIRETLDAERSAQQVLRPDVTSACMPEVDSLVVVEVICAIEELLGVTLPTSFAPRGGYNDVEACVTDLLAQTRGVWVELRKQKEEHHA
jgi:acyl carrier protein